MREEEKTGGFEPGAADDESFALESMDSYPGTLPDFDKDEFSKSSDFFVEDELETEAEPEIESEAEPLDEADATEQELETQDGVTMAEQIDTPEEGGSVWDSLDDAEEEIPDTNDFGLDDEDEESSAGSDLDEDEEEEIPPAEKETEDADEAVGATRGELQEDEPGRGNEEIDEADTEEIDKSGLQEDDPPEAIEEEDSGDMFTLDDDFKKMIEQDVEKSKSRRAGKVDDTAETAELTDEEMQEKLNEFESVDESDDAAEIDLTNIEAEHPSNYREKVRDSEPDSDIGDAQDDIEPEIKPIAAAPKVKRKKKAKEKKERKRIPPIVFIAAAIVVALAILAGGAYFIYDKYLNNPGIAVKDTTETEHESSDSAKHESRSEHEDNSNLDHKEEETETAESDTTASVEESDEESLLADVEVIEGEPEKPVEEPKHTTTKPKPKPKTTPKTTPTIAQKPKRDEIKVATSDEKEVYTVQVYSTPSREDAEQRLEILKSKNAPGAYISTYKKRDQIWYRVRFGSFSNADEAKNAAVRMGFPDSWIDRLK